MKKEKRTANSSRTTKDKDKKKKKKKYPQAKVLHDYEGESETELTIQAGWVIDVLNKTNDDWWEGRYKGKIGFFPRVYVEIIDEKTSSGKTDDEVVQVICCFYYYYHEANLSIILMLIRLVSCLITMRLVLPS